MAKESKCYHHPSQDAVGKCKECEKGICQNCHDVYGFTSGTYAGQSLCYDCTWQLVEKNVVKIERDKLQLKKEQRWMVIGMVAGALLGIIISIMTEMAILAIIYGFLLAAVGGSIGTIAKKIKEVHGGGNNDFSIILAIAAAIGLLAASPVMTIYRFIKRFKEIKKDDEIIASYSRVLQKMKDHFEYTQVMEKSAGVALAKLTEQGSELFGNTYAKAVLDKGEKEAQAELRQSIGNGRA